MIDWTKSMEQWYEYYVVDPYTWNDSRKLDTVVSSSINRDITSELLVTGNLEMDGTLDECYVRIYLVCRQNGVTYKEPLATLLLNPPNEKYNGKYKRINCEGYSPLLEMREKYPAIGYTLPKGSDIMYYANNFVFTNTRAPHVFDELESDKELDDDFIANTDDTWLSYTTDLLSKAKYHLDIDPMGKILFGPDQKPAGMNPVYTFTDDNSTSILLPDLQIDKDIYGIPNAVEVIYSKSSGYMYSYAENTDPNSLVSTVNRGRKIVYRDTQPGIYGTPTQAMLDEYARHLLESLSAIKYKITFSHGYCNARPNDCVELNYRAHGLYHVKAKVISQTIKCSTGCSVTTTAEFTDKLWRG